MTVVVDAVNDSEAARDAWRRAAGAASTQVRFVLLTLSDVAQHRRRLEARERGMVHVGEPTWEQVRARAPAYEPWVGPFREVDARRPVAEVVAQVLAALD